MPNFDTLKRFEELVKAGHSNDEAREMVRALTFKEDSLPKKDMDYHFNKLISKLDRFIFFEILFCLLALYVALYASVKH